MIILSDIPEFINQFFMKLALNKDYRGRGIIFLVIITLCIACFWDIINAMNGILLTFCLIIMTLSTWYVSLMIYDACKTGYCKWREWRFKCDTLRKLCSLPKSQAEKLDYVFRRPRRKALIPPADADAVSLCAYGYLTTDYIERKSAKEGEMCYIYSMPSELWHFINQHHNKLRDAWGVYSRPDLDKYQRIAPEIEI